jgi:hypothetical protein
VTHSPLTAWGRAYQAWRDGSTAQASGDTMSKHGDEQFDKLYNYTLEHPLPNVRFARIDYMNVTYITTKWAVWRSVALYNVRVCPG